MLLRSEGDFHVLEDLQALGVEMHDIVQNIVLVAKNDLGNDMKDVAVHSSNIAMPNTPRLLETVQILLKSVGIDDIEFADVSQHRFAGLIPHFLKVGRGSDVGKEFLDILVHSNTIRDRVEKVELLGKISNEITDAEMADNARPVVVVVQDDVANGFGGAEEIIEFPRLQFEYDKSQNVFGYYLFLRGDGSLEGLRGIKRK
jgi:hypothetical protein